MTERDIKTFEELKQLHKLMGENPNRKPTD